MNPHYFRFLNNSYKLNQSTYSHSFKTIAFCGNKSNASPPQKKFSYLKPCTWSLYSVPAPTEAASRLGPPWEDRRAEPVAATVQTGSTNQPAYGHSTPERNSTSRILTSSNNQLAYDTVHQDGTVQIEYWPVLPTNQPMDTVHQDGTVQVENWPVLPTNQPTDTVH